MRIKWVVGLVAVCVALAGCSTQANVSMQTSVQTKYSHVWLTIQEVWFNSSATATPEDTSWNKFPLSTPITLDLAVLTNGTLGQIASGLKLAAGTYAQVRLIPLDSSAPLASSASALSAIYNAEADYTDASGNAQRAPLELLNPDKGIGVATTLTVKASLAELGSIGTSTTNTTDCAAGDITCTPTSTTSTTPTSTTCVPGDTTCTPSTSCSVDDPSCTPATTPTVTSTPTGTTSTASTSVAVTVDGIHDLVQFAYGNQIGVMLNPHSSAYDVTTTGTIRGSIDATNITSSTGQVDAQVTAETLSADGTRHVAVMTAQVAQDGSFVLYPLPAGSSATTTSTSTTSATSTTVYDLVIHGPQVASIIIKGIPVSAGDPSSSAAVSIGTVTPRAATSYTFNLAAGSAALPAGALVDLYQTIPASGELPYLVDQVAVDPFFRDLVADESVPTGTIDWGTYVSGGNVALSTVTPTQGQSTFFVGAEAPQFTASTSVTALSPPASGTGPVQIAVPTPIPASGTGTVSITVTAGTPGKYNQGELIFSHDGQVVQTVAIDSILTQNGGATLQVQGIPAGGSASSFDNAVYYVSTRAWNSSDPAGTLQRQSFTTPVDLSSGSATGPTVNVD